ncbi:hypothetical protein fugu_006460 [Takifugu bimaculatus]|uniref:Uncharacterized protein n=1 Tax=Takifugu bimaculatus TaxID=433685 RepID=A0A4Z2B8T2_9TELE|nr:hypothetical protein fugu_006460 [Takifugu bimaculatus]
MESEKRPKASKIPVHAKKHPTLAESAGQTGKTKLKRRSEKEPQTELEKLDFLRSKLERSADEFIKTRKELEEILSEEGSSEQLFLTDSSSAGLKTELQRHRELTSKVESSLKELHRDHKPQAQGSVKKGSSYEFLKSIIG